MELIERAQDSSYFLNLSDEEVIFGFDSELEARDYAKANNLSIYDESNEEDESDPTTDWYAAYRLQSRKELEDVALELFWSGRHFDPSWEERK